MKTLILIRHAKAESGRGNLEDIDRPLSPLGRRDAAILADQLRDLAIAPPDLLVSSPAVRARATAEIFAGELSLPVREDSRIYEAGSSDLFDVVHSLKSRSNTAVLVGHNPGLQQFLCELDGHHFLNFPACTVAVVRLSVGSWRRVSPGKGELMSSFTPREGPLKREAAPPPMPNRGDRIRMWSLQNRSKLIGMIILTIGLLLLAGILPFALRSSTSSAGKPAQGSQP